MLNAIVFRAGDTLLMEAMLAAGAEPNQKDLRGETALQVESLIPENIFVGEVKVWKVGFLRS